MCDCEHLFILLSTLFMRIEILFFLNLCDCISLSLSLSLSLLHTIYLSVVSQSRSSCLISNLTSICFAKNKTPKNKNKKNTSKKQLPRFQIQNCLIRSRYNVLRLLQKLENIFHLQQMHFWFVLFQPPSFLQFQVFVISKLIIFWLRNQKRAKFYECKPGKSLHRGNVHYPLCNFSFLFLKQLSKKLIDNCKSSLHILPVCR